MLVFVNALARMLCIVIALAPLRGASEAKSHRPDLEFDKYPATVYDGPFKIPNDLQKNEKGEWHDSNNKLVAPPQVTFAGEYYLAGRSCGTGCRYYELLNLRTGEIVHDIARFDTGEPPPRTPDGHEFLTILYFRPGSRMIKAEYLLDVFGGKPGPETCRQQYFVLDNGKIYSISKTYPFCTELGQH